MVVQEEDFLRSAQYLPGGRAQIRFVRGVHHRKDISVRIRRELAILPGLDALLGVHESVPFGKSFRIQDTDTFSEAFQVCSEHQLGTYPVSVGTFMGRQYVIFVRREKA